MDPFIAKYDEFDDILSNIQTVSISQIIDFILTKFTKDDNQYIYYLIITFSIIRPNLITYYASLYSQLKLKRKCCYDMMFIYKENPIFLQHLIDLECYKEDSNYMLFSNLNMPLDYTYKSIEYALKHDDIDMFNAMVNRPNFTYKSFVTTNNYDFFMREVEISMLSFSAL